jgi:hypothetical protein
MDQVPRAQTPSAGRVDRMRQKGSRETDKKDKKDKKEKGDDVLSQSTPLNHGCRLTASLPSSPNPLLPLIVSVPVRVSPNPTPPLPPPPPPQDLEPNLSSGSHNKEAKRSVHSADNFG